MPDNQMQLGFNRELDIEYVEVDSLLVDPANPRTISNVEMDRLTKSIRELGFAEPVVARKSNRMIIGGHQRVTALRKLGYSAVPVVFLDIDQKRAKLLNVALNKLGGEFDEELLAALLTDLDEQNPEIDLTITGFDETEIDELLSSLESREMRERPETFDFAQAFENARTTTNTEQGDIWALGSHRIACGDSTDPGTVNKLLKNTTPSMAFTDPPYNVNYSQPSTGKKLVNDQLSADEWEEFVKGWASNLLDAVEGAIYVCMSAREWPSVSGILAKSGGHWSTTIIWNKDQFTLGRSDYQRGFEPIWYGWRQDVKHFWCGDRNQSDVWNIKRPTESKLHPTMKPLELAERAIENSSQPNETVFDPFSGSGTTLIACERTGRKFAGIELDPMYVDAQIARWESFTGNKAIKSEKEA